jgi:hypothetical protein
MVESSSKDQQEECQEDIPKGCTMTLYYFDSMLPNYPHTPELYFNSDKEAIEYGKTKNWCDVVYRQIPGSRFDLITLWESKESDPQRFERNSR